MNTKNLTKTQRKQLETVLSNILRAKNYLTRPEVMGIAEKINPDKALGCDYLVKNPAASESCTNTPPAIGLRNHFNGSDIAGLYTALSLLSDFLKDENEELESAQQAYLDAGQPF